MHARAEVLRCLVIIFPVRSEIRPFLYDVDVEQKDKTESRAQQKIASIEPPSPKQYEDYACQEPDNTHAGQGDKDVGARPLAYKKNQSPVPAGQIESGKACCAKDREKQPYCQRDSRIPARF